MAVVVSQEQNEVQTFEKWGLDIKAHRQKMQDRKLDEEFQKADAPLRIVFVCAMWLTTANIITIRDILWQELPESYSEESIIQYRDAVYDYVSQHYSRMALSLH